MRTWSVERAVQHLGAHAAAAADAVLEMLWPPRTRYYGADQLAEAEAEEEVWEGGVGPLWTFEHEEPSLTDDELVAVRQLIEERFGDQTKDSSLVHGVPGDGGEAVCSFPPGPASPHPNPTLGKVHRYWTGDLAAWLEPAVMTAIDEHRPDYYERDGIYCCGVRCPDWGDWYQHVAPLLAAHVAQALPDYPHHHCEFPDAAPGQRWRCYCGRAWRAVEDGPLDIAWEPHPLNQPT